MRRVYGIAAAVGALAMASVAASAHAADGPKTLSNEQAFTVDPNVWSAPAPTASSRSLQWNGKGRWGLKLDYSQPTTRDMEAKDVAFGPTYKITKRMQLRGVVNLGDQTAPRVITPDEKPQPRVRLETLFRF